jgi:nucleotide-binding universal stress UspA family protein
MFQHILVPTDFSNESSHALDIALTIVSRDGGKVSLLHVIETIAHTAFGEFEGFYKTLEKRAWDSMNALVAPYYNRDVAVEPSIEYGGRVERILSYATDHKIDLIVMHSHKIRPEDPIHGWGTISYKVGVLSQCPVMLVK